jgi:heme/copper-type cytochrome/quinol oxidase subunit 2
MRDRESGGAVKRAMLSATVGVTVLVLAGCGGSSSSTTSSTETTQTTATDTTTTETTQTTTQATGASQMKIVVVGGVPQNGIVRQTVKKGDRVVVLVTSDVSDEVHVHGYDLKGDVAPGAPARIAFVAKLPGQFEIELEKRSLQIGELTVES